MTKKEEYYCNSLVGSTPEEKYEVLIIKSLKFDGCRVQRCYFCKAQFSLTQPGDIMRFRVIRTLQTGFAFLTMNTPTSVNEGGFASNSKPSISF